MNARALVSKLDTSNGAMILVFGLFLFSIQDIIIKHFSSNYSVLQIVFVRGLIALGLFWLLFKFMRETISLRSRRPWLMVARGLLGFASYTCYYLAVAAMPLAEVVSITFTMPLFVTAMSALILGEKVGFRRWTAVVVGFIGVLIILSPDGEFNSLAVAFTMTAAISRPSDMRITRHPDGAHLHFDTIVGRNYQVSASPDLSPGSWSNVGAEVTGNGNPAEVTDPADVGTGFTQTISPKITMWTDELRSIICRFATNY